MLYRLAAGVVVLAIAIAFVALCMAAWIAVFIVGLIHPRLSPRRTCTWTLEFIAEAVEHVDALRG
jgi:hypothetical protein